ncbi:MAG: 5'-nucleotidase C-terminal domain-containing protein [Gammaproteobacteria bacterium]|nr:5'-nucleotidase C-terminal domain-containing protein [Gammaproteobacteria bacterium]
MQTRRTHLAAAISAVCITLTAASASATSLTLFHNNDGESTLLGSNGFGGFEYFLNELESARDAAAMAGRDTLTLSSGDNFLAGIAFEASQDRRTAAGGLGSSYGSDNLSNNYYDAIALAVADYDAITLGNHDFDFGPEVLADFIGGYRAAGGEAAFLSANLDFSADPNLSLLTSPTSVPPAIARSTIVTAASGEQYGIIGATTESVDNISSPGPTIGINDVVTAIQAEVTALEAAGVNKIILSSHLQSIANEQSLVPLLEGVDVVIAGGGDELLANVDDALTSDPFQPNIEGPYPVVVDRNGQAVPIVTTVGEYRYVGKLEVEFDAAGNVTSFGGDPILVDPGTAIAATGDRTTAGGVTVNIQTDIIEPLTADDSAIRGEVIGSTEIFLNGIRADIRTGETNLGNLVTDAFVFSAEQLGGLDPNADGVIGVTNGGGIRAAIDAGEITNADVISVLPFANSLVVLNGFTVMDLVAALQHSVSAFPSQSGGFLQISGIEFEFNQYSREVMRVLLEDGTEIYNASLGGVQQDLVFDLVTNSFTAAGGDGYDVLAQYLATDLGISYAEALRQYVRDGLGGTVAAVDYGATQGRISAVPVPAVMALIVAGMVGLGFGRRRATAGQ